MNELVDVSTVFKASVVPASVVHIAKGSTRGFFADCRWPPPVGLWAGGSTFWPVRYPVSGLGKFVAATFGGLHSMGFHNHRDGQVGLSKVRPLAPLPIQACISEYVHGRLMGEGAQLSSAVTADRVTGVEDDDALYAARTVQELAANAGRISMAWQVSRAILRCKRTGKHGARGVTSDR
jgi:hypothetical protein